MDRFGHMPVMQAGFVTGIAASLVAALGCHWRSSGRVAVGFARSCAGWAVMGASTLVLAWLEPSPSSAAPPTAASAPTRWPTGARAAVVAPALLLALAARRPTQAIEPVH